MTDIKFEHFPNEKNDAIDKAIQEDMFPFTLDNRQPSSIMLISMNVDFASALHILSQREYTIIVVIPYQVKVSSTLRNAGNYVWDWSSVAPGEGFVQRDKIATPRQMMKKMQRVHRTKFQQVHMLLVSIMS